METSRVIFFLLSIDHLCRIFLLSFCYLFRKASQHSDEIFPKIEFDELETTTTVV